MSTKVVPMVNVPDVKSTVAWYESIGLSVRATHEEPGCPMDWASLLLGASEVMFSAGGKAGDVAPKGCRPLCTRRRCGAALR